MTPLIPPRPAAPRAITAPPPAAETAESQRGFRALDRLRHDNPPTRGNKTRPQQPLWFSRLPATVPAATTVPTWGWHAPGLTGFHEVVTLDVNGGWFGPLSGTDLAFDDLTHTGPKDYDRLPGFWCLDTSTVDWPHPGIVNPLGMGPARPHMWLAGPTMDLLAELHRGGPWPALTILDSWTSDKKVRPVDWAAMLRQHRAAALTQWRTTKAPADRVAYAGIKESLGIAITMMENSSKSAPLRRPDWGYTMRAAAFATIWRKAWYCHRLGLAPVAMQSKDELAFLTEDLDELLAHPKCPIALDDTGIQLGTFKVKTTGKVRF
jgi:hypothetical protein